MLGIVGLKGLMSLGLGPKRCRFLVLFLLVGFEEDLYVVLVRVIGEDLSCPFFVFVDKVFFLFNINSSCAVRCLLVTNLYTRANIFSTCPISFCLELVPNIYSAVDVLYTA